MELRAPFAQHVLEDAGRLAGDVLEDERSQSGAALGQARSVRAAVGDGCLTAELGSSCRRVVGDAVILRSGGDTMTVSGEQARRAALALPEAIEQDHHGRPSFRVAGKIFATLWDEVHMNVMLDEGGILTAVEREPEVCAEVWWGKRLAAVRVDLRSVDPQMLTGFLSEAWEIRAPKRLVGGRSSSGSD